MVTYPRAEADLAVWSESALRPPFFFCSLPPNSIKECVQTSPVLGVVIEATLKLYASYQTFPGLVSSFSFELHLYPTSILKDHPVHSLGYFAFQIRKALELYEQLQQRVGVVVVGPSGSGKSTVWRMLRAAMMKCGQTVKQYTMNPKAMPRTQVGQR